MLQVTHTLANRQDSGESIELKKLNLIWEDMEMTGLNPDNDYIIEVAAVITDFQLRIIAQAPAFVIHQSNEIMDGMDAWNKSTHSRSGLIKKVKESTLKERDVELFLIDFFKKYTFHRSSPMCGNTICQDRRFMALHARIRIVFSLP